MELVVLRTASLSCIDDESCRRGAIDCTAGACFRVSVMGINPSHTETKGHMMNNSPRIARRAIVMGLTALVAAAVLTPNAAFAAPVESPGSGVSSVASSSVGIQNMGDTLKAGQRVVPGQVLTAADGRSSLVVTQDAITYVTDNNERWRIDANRIEMGTDGMVLTFKVNSDQSISNINKQANTAGWGDTLRLEPQTAGLVIRSEDKRQRAGFDWWRIGYEV